MLNIKISILVTGIAHAMALGLGPWMAVEIPDLIDKVTMVTKGFSQISMLFMKKHPLGISIL